MLQLNQPNMCRNFRQTYKFSMNLTKVFEQLKLTQNHSRIYETIIKYKQLSILELSKLTNIPRSTIYEYLPGLTDIGLVSIQKQGKSSILRAETPEKLLKYLELKVKEVNYEYQFLLDHKKELLEDFSKEPQDDLIKIINDFKKLTKIFNSLVKYVATSTLS